MLKFIKPKGYTRLGLTTFYCVSGGGQWLNLTYKGRQYVAKIEKSVEQEIKDLINEIDKTN